MSLAETELTIGGTSFKGVYIAILLSLATTLGGGVWTASSLYARLEAVEKKTIPDIAPLQKQILQFFLVNFQYKRQRYNSFD